MRIKTLMIGISVIVISITVAQNPYLGDASIGAENRTEEDENGIHDKMIFPYRPITEWEGERFIFLPKSKKSQRYGYQSFLFNEDKWSDHPTYSEYVGRIAVVTNVAPKEIARIVTFVMEDDSSEIIGKAFSESLDGVGPVADIDSARTRWLRDTLWCREGHLGTYDAESGEFGRVIIKKYMPVRVINIVTGWYKYCPVRFIIEYTDEDGSTSQGYQDINLSDTNVPKILQGRYCFEDYFSESDPREEISCSDEVWEAIQSSKVFVGMTAVQARWSWGEPSGNNITIVGESRHEQWVYEDESYLYLEDGIVTSLQVSKPYE